MSMKKINVAIVGLGFGAEFIPIYQRHPNASMYAICQRTRKKLDAIGNAFGVETRYSDFNDLINDPKVDVVHINSPIPDHASQSIAALKAGKDVACTVPMATSIEDSDLTARIYRSLFDTARQYRESIDVYGSKKSFEWTLVEHESHILHTAKKPEQKIPKKIKVPDYAKLVPAPIRRFTTKGVYDLAKKTHLSFTQGAGHGGSHPHLVHEFLSAVVNDRDPFPNAKQSANWPRVGLCALEYALYGGPIVDLPAFTI